MEKGDIEGNKKKKKENDNSCYDKFTQQNMQNMVIWVLSP